MEKEEEYKLYTFGDLMKRKVDKSDKTKKIVKKEKNELKQCSNVKKGENKMKKKNKGFEITYGEDNIQNYINLDEVEYINVGSDYRKEPQIPNEEIKKLKVCCAYHIYKVIFHFKSGKTQTEKMNAIGYEDLLKEMDILR